MILSHGYLCRAQIVTDASQETAFAISRALPSHKVLGMED